MSSNDDQSGYEVVAPLGSGPYGENLIAVRRDRFGIEKLVVLRQLRRNLSTDQGARSAFIALGKRAVRLSHPNLLATLELGERGGALFAVTEYLEGETLDAIMAAVSRAPSAVDPRLWLLVATEVLAGLHHAHGLRDFDGSELDLVHGSVTPRKITVAYTGRIVASDFGYAALATHVKRVEGTYLPEMLTYAAPEQRDGRPCDPRADVYSVALILWELLSGRRYRPGDPQAPLEPPPALADVAPQLDAALAEVVTRGLGHDPDSRWESAAAFRAALLPFVARAEALRPNAVGEAVAALFANARDKIPSLLARRTRPLSPQHAYEVTLAGDPSARREGAPPSGPDDEGEAPFLLESPIESVSEANVLSVTELVSESDLERGSEAVLSASELVPLIDDSSSAVTQYAAPMRPLPRSPNADASDSDAPTSGGHSADASLPTKQ